jgi:hypothetical protein
MVLTKDFNETVKAKIQKSAAFRRALLKESVQCMIDGDLETGKSVLRKYINATIGFVQLGADLGRSPKVLMRMLSASGNPQARNLFELVSYLQKREGIVMRIVDKAA